MVQRKHIPRRRSMSAAACSTQEPGYQGRVTRARSHANASSHSEECSLPSVVPQKDSSPSPNLQRNSRLMKSKSTQGARKFNFVNGSLTYQTPAEGHFEECSFPDVAPEPGSLPSPNAEGSEEAMNSRKVGGSRKTKFVNGNLMYPNPAEGNVEEYSLPDVALEPGSSLSPNAERSEGLMNPKNIGGSTKTGNLTYQKTTVDPTYVWRTSNHSYGQGEETGGYDNDFTMQVTKHNGIGSNDDQVLSVDADGKDCANDDDSSRGDANSDNFSDADVVNSLMGGADSDNCAYGNAKDSVICSAICQEPSTATERTAEEVINAIYNIVNSFEESQQNQPQSSGKQTETSLSTQNLQFHSKDFGIQQRRKRGPTRALDVLMLPKGKRIKIMCNDYGEAIGENASKLSSFLGTLARNGHIAPINYKDWRMMPETCKEKMWNCILEKFEFDKHMNRWVMVSLSSKWKNWKSTLKKERYDKHETDEQRLADLEERVLPDQWAELVHFWSSEEGKNRSNRNKVNRAKQVCIHTTGTKSFARIREEERAQTQDGSDPSRVEFFIKTHKKKNGEIVNARSREIIAEFNNILSELPVESQNKDIQDNIFSQVMGEDRHGPKKNYLPGPVPSDSRSPDPIPSRAESSREASRSAIRAAIAEQKTSILQRQMEEMWQENHQLREENEKMKQQLQKMVDILRGTE